MAREGLMTAIRRTQRFERVCDQRRRVNFQICKDIYNEEMDRKIAFLARKNRADAYPGQY